MFSGQLPPYLDLRKFSDQERVIEGDARVGDFPGLREYHDSLGQPVRVELAFVRDEDGRRRLRGCIETCLTLTCQRCLEPVEQKVNARVDLVLVWGEGQAKALPPDLEPLLVQDDRMPLSDLVEEELFLAMPLVALHDPCPQPLPEPGAPKESEGTGGGTGSDNPFAVLAQLKGRRK